MKKFLSSFVLVSLFAASFAFAADPTCDDYRALKTTLSSQQAAHSKIADEVKSFQASLKKAEKSFAYKHRLGIRITEGTLDVVGFLGGTLLGAAATGLDGFDSRYLVGGIVFDVLVTGGGEYWIYANKSEVKALLANIETSQSKLAGQQRDIDLTSATLESIRSKLQCE